MISFFVPGVPVPKGSARAYVIGGVARITNANASTRPWQNAITAEAALHGPPEPLNGPCRVEVLFLMPRPKGHFGAKGLRPSAPKTPDRKPDLDKLERALLDALTVAGFWRDDAQVCDINSRKRYAGKEHTGSNGLPGVLVSVETLP